MCVSSPGPSSARAKVEAASAAKRAAKPATRPPRARNGRHKPSAAPLDGADGAANTELIGKFVARAWDGVILQLRANASLRVPPARPAEREPEWGDPEEPECEPECGPSFWGNLGPGEPWSGRELSGRATRASAVSNGLHVLHVLRRTSQ